MSGNIGGNSGTSVQSVHGLETTDYFGGVQMLETPDLGPERYKMYKTPAPRCRAVVRLTSQETLGPRSGAEQRLETPYWSGGVQMLETPDLGPEWYKMS